MRPLLALIGIITLLGVSASAADRFVDVGKGDDLKGANDCLDRDFPCKTITQAIKRSKPSDRIHVGSGTYIEEKFPLLVEWRLEIIPWQPDKPKPIIDTGPAEAAIIIGENASGSVIQGFYIRFSPKNGAEAALVVRGASFVKLKQLTVDLKDKGGTGILLRESLFSKIIENTVLGRGGKEDKGHDGIRIEGGANNVLSGNRAYNNDGAGIFVEKSDGNKLLNNATNGNFFGIALLESSGNLLLGNEATGNTLGGIGLACVGITCKGNELRDNRASGTQQLSGIILVGRFVDTVLKGNIASLNKNRAGIELGGDFRNTLISGNTANNNQFGFFIEFEGLGRNALSDNIANGNDIGIYLAGSNSTLSGNKANTNKKSGIKITGSNNTLSGNTANNNSESGIALRQGSENRLLNNTALSNGTGISLKGSHNNRLLGNAVRDNRCNGIELENSSQNEIRNNTVALNAKDTKCADHQQLRGGLVLIGASISNKISGNVIQENFNGISVREGSQKNEFKCNSILRNEKNGIQLLSLQAVSSILQKNNIEGNQAVGLRNFTDRPVDARHNWWSHPSGPSTSSNPAGKGDKILGPALFAPWLESPMRPNDCS